MSLEEARKRLDDAQEEAYRKRRAYLDAKLKAEKLMQAYDKACEENEPDERIGELSENWYESERQMRNAQHEAQQADEREQKALEAYQQAEMDAGSEG